MNVAQLDQIGLVVGAVLTLMIFSYLLADNALYRIAIHVFIGAAAGFLLIAALEGVLIPWLGSTVLAQPAELSRIGVGLMPFMFGLLLAFKGSPRFSKLGDYGLTLMIGVGAALALVGAVNGTLLPLIAVTVRELRPENVINGAIGVIGTVSVLVFFTYFGVRRPSGAVEALLPVRFVGWVGQAFIAVTLGATYGLLILSALTALTGVITDRLLPWIGR